MAEVIALYDHTAEGKRRHSICVDYLTRQTPEAWEALRAAVAPQDGLRAALEKSLEELVDHAGWHKREIEWLETLKRPGSRLGNHRTLLSNCNLVIKQIEQALAATPAAQQTAPAMQITQHVQAPTKPMMELVEWLAMPHDVAWETHQECAYWANQFKLACAKARKALNL